MEGAERWRDVVSVEEEVVVLSRGLDKKFGGMEGRVELAGWGRSAAAAST